MTRSSVARPSWPKAFVVRFLAHRIQESESGELSAGTGKRLKQIAKAVEKDPAAEISPAPAFKAGTRLIRQWRDQTHVVAQMVAKRVLVASLIIMTSWRREVH